MGKVVTEGTQLKCQFGSQAAILNVLSNFTNTIDSKKIATINDYIPFACISSFGQCSSQMNPAVIAAQAAGSPSPPCTPAIVAPWQPGANKMTIGGIPVLLDNGKTSCTFAPNGIGIDSVKQNSTNSQ